MINKPEITFPTDMFCCKEEAAYYYFKQTIRLQTILEIVNVYRPVWERKRK